MASNSSNEMRIGGTIVIWVAFAISLAFVNGGAAANEYSLVMAFLSALLAMFATSFLWLGEWLIYGREKSKRQESTGVESIALLLQLLNEDDREMLKHRLIQRLQNDEDISVEILGELELNEVTPKAMSRAK